MATIPTNEAITLACPSCGSENLESWNQKVVIHPDNDDDAPGNPLQTRGEYVAITFTCGACLKEGYLATGNHKGQQEFGIFAGSPAHPVGFVEVKPPKGMGAEISF